MHAESCTLCANARSLLVDLERTCVRPHPLHIDILRRDQRLRLQLRLRIRNGGDLSGAVNECNRFQPRASNAKRNARYSIPADLDAEQVQSGRRYDNIDILAGVRRAIQRGDQGRRRRELRARAVTSVHDRRRYPKGETRAHRAVALPVAAYERLA